MDNLILVRELSPTEMFWRRFKRHRLALISSGFVILWILVAMFPSAIAPYSPYKITPAFRQPPSQEHLLGTDLVGRDVMSRIIYGSRTSLIVGIGSVGVSVLIGVILGALAGYKGGLADFLVTRLIDLVLSFPLVVVILTIVSLTGASLRNVILVLGMLQWPPVARYVRAEFMSMREREFIIAANAYGATSTRIMFRHILPNAISPVVVVATFGVASAIIIEAALSFLGWGVPPPTASWGSMLMDAQKLTILESMPWLWVPPGLMISMAVLAVNFVGDGLRDALDPRMIR